MPPDKMKTLHRDSHLFMATQGAIFINIWQHAVGVDRLKLVRDAEVGFNRSLGHNHYVITVVRRPRQMFTLNAEERAESMATMKTLSPLTMAQATLLVGTGMWIASARALMSGLKLIIRQPFPDETFASVELCAAWMSDQMSKRGHHTSTAEVADFIRAADKAADAP